MMKRKTIETDIVQEVEPNQLTLLLTSPVFGRVLVLRFASVMYQWHFRTNRLPDIFKLRRETFEQYLCVYISPRKLYKFIRLEEIEGHVMSGTTTANYTPLES
ncbi:hypothetical protein OUZ56_004297 [Daphnia magna]|uniref:Uncharacterized protein n=1 Tax=Daphnia magna TaxID=35525 RepID=A0ABQ9YPC9_9CRUS|nr:hypothetical protein OUZ56_004297 [Daphnia magna]